VAEREPAGLTDLLSRLHTKLHHGQSKVLIFIKEASGYRVVHWFRNYATFSVVASSAFLVSATNFSHGKDANSLLFGYADGQQELGDGALTRTAAQVGRKENLSLVPLAAVNLSADPDQKDDTTLFDIDGVSLQNQMVLSLQVGSHSAMAKDPEEDGGVKIYTVLSGDTVSGIAAQYGITANTILWANDLDNPDEIKPGDQIFILPVAGLSYVVRQGDTLESIASKYKAEKEKIISFNSLPANGEIAVGDSLIIPDGQKDEPISPSATANAGSLARRQYATTGGGTATDISGYRTLDGRAGTGHRFPYGWCTWYVSQKRYVPWGGNAGTWLYNAKSLGYKTGRSPRPGAIMVTTENRYYGHVALVEKVNGDTITVSEMNYVRWGKMSRRTLSASSRAIKGFIY
jgi:surface antigen/LysM repeat protein